VEPEETREFIAGEIRRRCKKRRVTQRQLADLAGVSFGHLERVLATENSPTSDWLTKIAEALGCRPRDLLP
jgi:transcriptional regulator with XRE-family HTH domain